MTKHIVSIRSNTPAQDPEIPECYKDSLSISQKVLKGTDWIWTESSVAIIATRNMKTIDDQIEMFQRYHEKNILRPVQAGELAQMERHLDLWRGHWQECAAEGRIFFVGTVYTLHYEEEVTYDLVWAAWYDKDQHEWVFNCIPTTARLWPNDLFACVAMGGKLVVEECIVKPPLPPPRRERERTVPRELLAIKR